MTSDSIVIIPTYNEKENMENIIPAEYGMEKCFQIEEIYHRTHDRTSQIENPLIKK